MESWNSLEDQIKEKDTFPRKKKNAHTHTHQICLQFQWVQRLREVCEIQARNLSSKVPGGLEGESIYRDFSFYLDILSLLALLCFCRIPSPSLPAFLPIFTSLILPFSILHPLPTLAIRQSHYQNSLTAAPAPCCPPYPS